MAKSNGTWSERKREYHREYTKKWAKENPEKRRAAVRKWRLANKEKIAERRKEYRAAYLAKHRDLVNAKQRAYKAGNKDRFRHYMRKYKGYPPPTKPCPEFCECCGRPPNGQGTLHLDHCHETNSFRGWLCSDCNLGLGKFGDSIDGLKLAVRYLENYLAISGVTQGSACAKTTPANS